MEDYTDDIAEIIRDFDEENLIRMIVLIGENNTSRVIEISNEEESEEEELDLTDDLEAFGEDEDDQEKREVDPLTINNEQQKS